jgi:hypothetical protein
MVLRQKGYFFLSFLPPSDFLHTNLPCLPCFFLLSILSPSRSSSFLLFHPVLTFVPSFRSFYSLISLFINFVPFPFFYTSLLFLPFVVLHFFLHNVAFLLFICFVFCCLFHLSSVSSLMSSVFYYFHFFLLLPSRLSFCLYLFLPALFFFVPFFFVYLSFIPPMFFPPFLTYIPSSCPSFPPSFLPFFLPLFLWRYHWRSVSTSSSRPQCPVIVYSRISPVRVVGEKAEGLPYTQVKLWGGGILPSF